MKFFAFSFFLEKINIIYMKFAWLHPVCLFPTNKGWIFLLFTERTSYIVVLSVCECTKTSLETQKHDEKVPQGHCTEWETKGRTCLPPPLQNRKMGKSQAQTPLSLPLSVFYKSYSGLLVLLLLWGFEGERERWRWKEKGGFLLVYNGKFYWFGGGSFYVLAGITLFGFGEAGEVPFSTFSSFLFSLQTLTLLSSFLLSFTFYFFNVIR